MRLKIHIEGMSCSNCVSHVKQALEKITGVSYVDVVLEDSHAYFMADESVTFESLKNAIESLGYELVGVTEN